MPRYSQPSQNVALSQKQKAKLAQVARKAYAIAKDHDLTDLTCDEWRHKEAIACIGTTISNAANGDYLKLLGHFENLAGNSGAAFNAVMRNETDAQRQGLYALEEALKVRGLDRNYADKISRNTFGVRLEEATPAQLQKLKFTIINRRKPLT